MCCNDASNVKNIDLKNSKFDEIKMKVNDSTLKFDETYHNGQFRIFDKGISSNINYSSPELNEYQKALKQLQDEIQYKDNKISELNNKIEDIDKKMEIMEKILNIDVSEKEYINELEQKLNEQNAAA